MSSRKKVPISTYDFTINIDWDTSKTGKNDLEDNRLWNKQWDKTEATENDMALVRQAAEQMLKKQ